MVPVLAALLPVIFFRARQSLAVHAVFALHFYAFLLVLVSVPVLTMAAEPLLGGDGKMSQLADDTLSIALVLTCATYMYVAIGRVYGTRGLVRIAQTGVLTLAVAANFLAYRFALFVITLYTA